MNKYLIKTRSQAKSSGIKVLEIHGVNKEINPHVKPERQIQLPLPPTHNIPPTNLAQPIDKGQPTHPIPKPRIGQGRAGLRRKIRKNLPIPLPKQMLAQPIPTPAPKEAPSLPEPIVQSQKNVQPMHHIPIALPQHQPVDPPDTTKLVQKFLPKQTDIDKILDIIKRKVLKGTHHHQEIQAGFLSSPYFKDLYLFLSQNKLPSKRSSIKKVETLAENFVPLGSLLFKLVTTPDRETALLAIPKICVDKIIALYHASLFSGHQGVVKTYLTMKDKFFVPSLVHYLRSFTKGCHICQLARPDKPPVRQLQPQIYLNYRPLSKLSMDLKVMP